MKIERINLHLVAIPLRKDYTNRYQTISSWKKLVIEVVSDSLSGWGECTSLPTPYFHYETVDSAKAIINQHLAKLLFACQDTHPEAINDLFSVINGHNEAKAALESACWDLYSRQNKVPLYEMMGGSSKFIDSSVTMGIMNDEKQITEVLDEIESSGYRRVKVKIKPGHDTIPLMQIRKHSPSLSLSADANCAYSHLDNDNLLELDDFKLDFIEQPVSKNSWSKLMNLNKKMVTPICLDESVSTVEDIHTMAHLKAGRYANINIGRLGGISNSIAAHNLCKKYGIPNYVGGKFESSIGRWASVALATLSNVTMASDVAESSYYFSDDIVDLPVKFSKPGFVQPLNSPGIGVQIDDDKLKHYKIESYQITPS